nr:DNA alkylation repair protein [Flexivirga oryzae]
MVALIRAELARAADPGLAPGMQAYMKSALPYYGVRVPRVRTLTRAAARQLPPADLAELADAARTLFDRATHREEWYAALALVGMPLARGRRELTGLHEHFAVAGAWWDVVDETAHRIAELHDAQPRHTAGIVRRWSVHDDMWLRRLAIISQLGRRNRVDARLLTEVIEANQADREFFIRKAIGWALREYARQEPEWVRRFVADHEQLSPLSRREALKHLRG